MSELWIAVIVVFGHDVFVDYVLEKGNEDAT